uniref:DNA replication complex GINS protein PSF3 n=1 Tax=Equus asinus TaxID=9793 RepID=A0A9L0JVA7_EQUAS
CLTRSSRCTPRPPYLASALSSWTGAEGLRVTTLSLRRRSHVRCRVVPAGLSAKRVCCLSFARWREEGSKLELPLWLAKGLFDNKRRILSVELPKIYQEGWRTVFSADANVVDLHKMGPHFYGFGSQLLHFDSPENADISQSLLQTFIGRFRRIMDSSQNAYNEDTSALVARLDEMERGLFQTGQKGLNDFQGWEKGQASQITASSLVQNYKKRKFTDMED